MIRNNDILDVIKIKNYMYGQCLSSNVQHNCNFNEFTIQLRYLFVWSYKTNCPKCISFVANRHIV